MGQGPSSVNYNYVYKDNNTTATTVSGVPVKMNLAAKQQETEKIKKKFNELLNVLKYHTNMISMDKNFILQNKLISDELDKKITHLNTDLKHSKDTYSRDNELYKQKSAEVESIKLYSISFKYADIGLFMVIVIIMGIRYIKKK
tara:strand:+ start:1677 stop:2108 length:432 start_codon:yes stop_codon:yes gene_type:complete